MCYCSHVHTTHGGEEWPSVHIAYTNYPRATSSDLVKSKSQICLKLYETREQASMETQLGTLVITEQVKGGHGRSP